MTTDIISPAVPLPAWAEGKVNLASPRMGTEVVSCTDDFFAEAGRMLQDALPVFRTDVYDDHGKWMDGWESRRRRDSGHDWCVIRLGVAGRISGVDIDTAHFTGNFPRAASLWGARGSEAPEDESGWTVLVPDLTLAGDSHHFAEVTEEGSWDFLRLNIYPDGGVARLRVYGEPAPEWPEATDELVELSALRNGGRVVGYNDAHYGSVWAVLAADRSENMGGGWETRRRREPGHDWLIIALGARGVIERVEIDTGHYKGNFPDRASLQAADVTFGTDQSVVTQAMFWPGLMGEKPLSADAIHVFEGADLASLGPVSHVKLNIHPDGGVARLRIWGRRA